ncbi:NADH-quinone oxidoreductase subunit G [Campylobacter lari]|uniref:NADH-quinone oxidoreductase subunit G n=1 Tax=Campylobacter lari TaxID=201 RepID=UPI0012711638|nr:NADH-quinone oxidoreductase subunit G [Campylobacter lari]EAJ6452525.1 NADH-quinone oxidoreductase subunit G [Campylobacter lari]EAK0771259.1 NADH-quinone oxidoreductase subunit G [Campylobacter lari]EAK6012044.1 NADH-quinone oxidoreductase subunit G [Campylobacter lari]EAK9997932.1 NADH-quinone oxidoreductase subunit G [Campylobacter lari]EDP6859810.1 NADH-quinone oxidoreductase subunit G [Campylobacter lari]
MKVIINGIECEANEGEYILNVARKNDIFIPAICYLNGCSPTLACRMCMVEADGKKVYSCNTKVKDGMVVESDLPNLWDERNAIMQAYCINHPLQCGVCDKSGECELQNFTHKARVNVQNYWIKDTHKEHKKWGEINYDPALCIVCERCITICKDKIGESALKTTPRGANAPDASFKESMSKDALAIWTKFQKSLIAPSNGDMLDCSFCGECTSVCPTGALVGANFQYTSNAWELKKIPASNPHSSDCELMYYDIKQTSINNQKEKIYRVSNDFAFATLNKAARYGFNIQNEVQSKDEKAFEKLVKMIQDQEIKNIKFNSFITNEEALILQNISDKFGIYLINEEAKKFQDFINIFYQNANAMYNANADDIIQSDFLIIAGSFLRYDAPTLGYKVNNALVMNKGAGLYFHPIKDKGVDKYSKNLLQINHDIKNNEDILLFILQKFAKEFPQEFKNTLENAYYQGIKEVEESINEEVIEKIEKQNENGETIIEEVKKLVPKKIKKSIEVQRSNYAKNLGIDEDILENLLAKRQKFTLIIGSDFYYDEKSINLAKLCTLVQKYTEFKVFLIPTCTNTLGVSLICDLKQDFQAGKTLGYNEKGDFTFSYDGHFDLASSALNQQEGSFVNYDKRLVPTNAALEFKGYFLNDLANALGFDEEFTINYTKFLPQNKGFRAIEFDELENYYDNGGANHRGYELDFSNLKLEKKEFSPQKIDENNGNLNLYFANPIHQFSKLSNKAFNEVGVLFLSPDLMQKFNLKDDDSVILKAKHAQIALSVKTDENLENGAYLGDYDSKLNTQDLFKGLRYIKIDLEKAGAKI